MKQSHLMMISEKEIRFALKSHLAVNMTGSDAIVEEMGIENGSARIDLAFISDRLSGYEIKSDFDNALRLFNQIHSYNRVFEHICIVTGPLSGHAIEALLPSWWGILRAKRHVNGEVSLEQIRLPKTNMQRDVYSLLTLFKRVELNDLASKYGLSNKLIKGAKQNLLDALALIIPLNDVNYEATIAIKSRAMLSSALS